MTTKIFINNMFPSLTKSDFSVALVISFLLLLPAISFAADIDSDGIDDSQDNCIEIPNSDQRDSNGDGFGNVCDADLDNNGTVSFADLNLFKSKFGTDDPDADFDGNGSVSFADLAIFRQQFGKPPGPISSTPCMTRVNHVPPIIAGATSFNKKYFDKMKATCKPLQESPWGFQEIMLENPVSHTVSSLQDYKNILEQNKTGSEWSDGKVHIIHFNAGTYEIPLIDDYYILFVPSKTIIQGAGIRKTIFKATKYNSRPTGTALFNLEGGSDIVLRNFSFYNESKDNHWKLIYAANHNPNAVEENLLFENIEFDDSFGAIGSDKAPYNFITLRGLKKRIGNTTQRIKENHSTPIPNYFQFPNQEGNTEHIRLAGQVGIRTGNSVVIHNCLLGDNISATLDLYSNYTIRD